MRRVRPPRQVKEVPPHFCTPKDPSSINPMLAACLANSNNLYLFKCHLHRRLLTKVYVLDKLSLNNALCIASALELYSCLFNSNKPALGRQLHDSEARVGSTQLQHPMREQ
eukprot:3842145-Amphidinium_carterae.1